MKKFILLIGLLAAVLPVVHAQRTAVTALAKKATVQVEKDLLELEKRFAKLKRFRSCTEQHKVKLLLQRRVPEEIKEPLEKMFQEGQFSQAEEFVRAWRSGVTVDQEAFSGLLGNRRDFVSQFKKLDLFQGSNIKKAVDLLERARQEGLINKTEYQNLLYYLSKRDMANVAALLEQTPHARIRKITPEMEQEAAAELKDFYSRESLKSKEMPLPSMQEQAKLLAIERVVGGLTGKVRQSVKAYKRYYDAQLPWVQESLDQQIASMEQVVKIQLERRSNLAKKREEVRPVPRSFTAFISGQTEFSAVVLEALYGPHTSVPKRLAVEEAFKEGADYKNYIAEIRALYAEIQQNRKMGITPAPAQNAEILDTLFTLKAYLMKNRTWPEEGSALFKRVEQLEQEEVYPAAVFTIKRLKSFQEKLPEMGLYRRLLEYTAQYGKLPPVSSSLYQSLSYYRKRPGRYQPYFIELYEKYRSSK